MGNVIDNKVYTEEFRLSAKEHVTLKAVEDEYDSLTYAQLDGMSDVLVHVILSKKIPLSSRIVVYMTRRKEIALAAIGIMKAGCVYIPVDYSYPVGRANYIVEDSNAKLVVTLKKDWKEKPLDIAEDRVIFIDELKDEEISDKLKLQVDIRPEMDAFAVYTSGSTGRPKGVLHTHRSFYWFASFQPDTEKPLDESSVYCNASSFSFIASIIDIFSPLLKGACLLIASEKTQKDMRRLHELICEKHVAIAVLSTRLALMLVETYDMSSVMLRAVGEKVTSFKPIHPSLITEAYGSSECGAIAYCRITGTENPMPLGRIREGVGYEIINNLGKKVPVGEVGELLISGGLTAKGYLNRSEETKSKFEQRDDGVWYHTGDLVRLDENGMLYYVQRKDFIYKIRGFRVEPGEIEGQFLTQYGEKVSGVVCVLKNVGGEDHLCLYYESDEVLDENEIRTKLSDTLASYLIPNFIIRLNKLPHTTNGKIDRLRLPDPEVGEEALSSISMMSIAADAYEKYGVTLEFREMLSAGTKKNIMALIEKKRRETGKNDDLYLPECKSAPLGFSQTGLFSECLSSPNSTKYNLPRIMHVPNHVSADDLEKALRLVIDAHPGIRCCLDSDGVSLMGGDLDIPRKTMTEKDFQIFKTDSIRPFSLKAGCSLSRFEIIETEEGLYLFTDIHHLICDGFSYNLFVTELVRVISGKTILKERFTSLQIIDEQNRKRSSQSHEDTIKYWEKLLSTIESASDIPTDVYDTTFGPEEQGCIYETVNVGAVRDLAKVLNVKKSAVYLAAFLLTVAAYTGDKNVGIMTISNGRRDARLARTFGMFVNTLPMIVSVDYEKTSEYIKAVQETLIGAIEHEDCSFSEISSKFDYKSGIMFADQEDLNEDEFLAKNGYTAEDVDTGVAIFPIYMSAIGSGNDIRLRLRYNKSLYSEKMMQDMCHTCAFIVNQLVKEEDLSSVKFCDEEQTAFLDAFNPVITEAKETETIVSMFRSAVKAYPDNNAVEFKGEYITYRQLDEKTDRIATYIYAHTNGKNKSDHEPVVSIMVHRGLNMVVCALSALKAGCAYQPLDPDYPDDRINFMIKDAEPVMLIADSDCCQRVNTFNGDILKTDDILSIPDNPSELNVRIAPEALFILLYTSGSTGNPKGVMLEHRNLVAFCRWYRRYYNLKPSNRVAGYASFGFDACMMDIYPALTTGACIYIIPEEMRLDLNAINVWFEKNSITHSFMTTQVGVQFHQTQKNHSLKHFSVGGEKLVSVKPGEGYIFHNGYGPTECTIFSLVKPVLKQEPNIPIGRPVDSLKCYVVDGKMRRLPIGASGELILAGAQVGRGYLNLSEKTKEVFTELNKERAYHTGDIVRYRADGDIEFIGRRDGQVKIRGFRIELKEIEAVIREYEGITDVTVQAFDAPKGGKFLAAYIVCDNSLNIDGLKSYILSIKPSYMLPASIMRLSAIPLNINNKVDKKALPAPEFISNNNYVEPVTDRERIVAEAIAFVTGVSDKVGALSSFSQLGGDSINALRLATELSKSQLVVTPAQILKLDIVREIAKATSQAKQTDSAEDRHFSGNIPNSAIVQYFYDLKLTDPGHFNQAMMYGAQSPIKMDILTKSFDILIRHHDILRAVNHDDSLFIREMDDGEMFLLKEETIDNLDATERELHNFDLENGPFVHACVFHATQKDYLLVVMHHLIVDGVSWRIFTEDLNTVYVALASDNEVRLPNGTNTYADYVDAQKRYCDSAALISQKHYWDNVRARMKNLPISDRSCSLPNLERINLSIAEDIAQNLLTNSQMAYNNRINDIFLAALGISYYELTKNAAVSLRVEGHGRESFDPDLNIDRTFGWFTSIYPVVLDNLDKDLSTVIIKTKETLRRIPNNGLGYGMLYGIETAKQPLITFNYLGRMSENISGGFFKLTDDYAVGDFISSKNCYGTDINLNGMLIDNEIRFILDYNSDHYSREQMLRLADGFIGTLKRIAEHIKSIQIPISTASDYGESKWTDEEFEFVAKDFAKRNEKILGIYPMSSKMKQTLFRLELTADIKANAIRVPIEVDGLFTKDDFLDVMSDMYSIYKDLSYAVAFYGVSSPRIVCTDRKPAIMYLDYSSEADPYVKMAETCEKFHTVFFNLQMHALMQLAVIKTGAKEHYLYFFFHRLWYDTALARARIEDYLRILDARSREKTNISEWMDMLRLGMIKDYTCTEEKKVTGKVSKNLSKNSYEEIISAIFETILDADQDTMTPESDFFRLGGDRYMCIELSDHLLREFNLAIPPAVLCQNTKIKDIASIIESGGYSEKFEDIHVFSEHPDKKPLIFVHTANTGSEAYYRLAKYIENDISFSVLEQYNINHAAVAMEDIPSLATKYIEIIKRIQPHGPYNLGGWCFGGTVAYEMARQLTMAGEVVDRLIMLDSHIVEDEGLKRRLEAASALHSREYLSTAPLFEDIRRKGLIERYIENSARSSRIWLNYDPPKYDGSTLYFKASVKAAGMKEAQEEMYDRILKKKAAGYEKKVPENLLRIINVAIDHDSMMDDDALKIIVPAIKQYMEC